MHQELTERYGISLLYKDLPNSVYGIYTSIRNKDYIVVNKDLHINFRNFCTVALFYFFQNSKATNMLTEHYFKDEQQLQAIEFAKEYFLNL